MERDLDLFIDCMDIVQIGKQQAAPVSAVDNDAVAACIELGTV